MRRVLLWILAITPFLVGYCVGIVIALLVIVWAALVEGYVRGRRHGPA